jgi:threonine dehydrogenase-like Zn-dependent dehydrogenase
MPTVMRQPALELVSSGTPNCQPVAVLEEAGKICVRFALVPEPTSTEILIKVLFNGICGSDLEAFRGTREPEFMAFPARLGHEVSGVVEKVGSSVLGITVGDKVTCRYIWGALARYVVCSPFNVKVVPPTLPLLEISLIEVLPGIIHAAELAKITPHSNILVTGQGVSGLVLTQVLKLFSPKTLAVTDLKARNLELARKYGATHTYKLDSEHTSTMSVVGKDFPSGFDIVIPCLLDGDGMSDALDACALGGKIIMYGCIGTCKSFDFFKMHRKRAEIYSTEPRRDIDMRRYFEEGMRMVVEGLVNTSEMITHIYPLSHVQEAFDLRNDKSASTECIHVLIDCQRMDDEIITCHPPTDCSGSVGGAALCC